MYKREASSENYDPRVYIYHILKYKKYLAAILFTLLYFMLLFIYLSLRDLILAINRQGIGNPFFALGASICFFVCRYC